MSNKTPLPLTDKETVEYNKIHKQIAKLDSAIKEHDAEKAEVVGKLYGATAYSDGLRDQWINSQIDPKEFELPDLSEAESVWKEALGEFKKLVGTGTLTPDKILKINPLPEGERSSYAKGTLNISKGSMGYAQSVTHEAGHWLEENDLTVKQKAHEFLERRTQGEKAKRLLDIFPKSSYSPLEKVKPDNFPNPYCGKLYSGSETEIISMGIEYFYSDPLKFAGQDPDYFDFIYNTLRGR